MYKVMQKASKVPAQGATVILVAQVIYQLVQKLKYKRIQGFQNVVIMIERVSSVDESPSLYGDNVWQSWLG